MFNFLLSALWIPIFVLTSLALLRLKELILLLRTIYSSLVLIKQIYDSPNFQLRDYVPVINQFIRRYLGTSDSLEEKATPFKVWDERSCIKTSKGCLWYTVDSELFNAGFGTVLEAYFPQDSSLNDKFDHTASTAWRDITPILGTSFQFSPEEIGAQKVRIVKDGGETIEYNASEKVDWPPEEEPFKFEI